MQAVKKIYSVQFLVCDIRKSARVESKNVNYIYTCVKKYIYLFASPLSVNYILYTYIILFAHSSVYTANYYRESKPNKNKNKNNIVYS